MGAGDRGTAGARRDTESRGVEESRSREVATSSKLRICWGRWLEDRASQRPAATSMAAEILHFVLDDTSAVLWKSERIGLRVKTAAYGTTQCGQSPSPFAQGEGL